MCYEYIEKYVDGKDNAGPVKGRRMDFRVINAPSDMYVQSGDSFLFCYNWEGK